MIAHLLFGSPIALPSITPVRAEAVLFDIPLFDRQSARGRDRSAGSRAGRSVIRPEGPCDRIGRDLALMEAARPEITGAPHAWRWVPVGMRIG